MPPFKSGLLKRKGDLPNTSKPEVSDEESNSFVDDELFKGEINLEGDETDSENETIGKDSDHEQDEVLYDDNTHPSSDEELTNENSDQSSELTDSEDDGESADDDGAIDKNDDESDKNDDESDKDDDESDKDEDESNKDEDESDKDDNEESSDAEKQGDEGRNITSASTVDRLVDSFNNATVTTLPVQQKDEYSSGDTSDEEDRRTTAGDVPPRWYRHLPHAGYDLDARPVLKPPQRDHIDDFLKKCEDPDFWRTVRDPSTGQDVVLSAADLELLRRVRSGLAPDPAHAAHAPWLDWFTRDVLAAPLRAFPDHKRSFLPSRDEARHVARLVHALRMGWLKTRRDLAAERRARRDRRFYDLWGAAPPAAGTRAAPRHLAAPRRALPSHAESYNPPPEYLLDADEMKEWDALAETPWKRKYTFLPRRYASLRAVPAHDRFVRERFLRCLDLYLAPRAIKMRLTIGAEELVPRLPAPRELRPFPTSEALVFRGHAGAVRSVDVDPSGQYAVSGGEDGDVRVWELRTARCVRTLALGERVARVAWTPAAGLSLVAAASGARLLLLNPGAAAGAHRVAAATDALLEEPPPARDVTMDARTAAAVAWQRVPPAEWARGVRVCVTHFRPVVDVAWHARGDYLVATLADAASRSVVVHQLSRRRSQLPFARAKGLVQCAAFHPTRPLLFVATQRAVRVYDLVKQELVRKLAAGAQWLSSMAVHPGGEHLLLGAYDRKAVWFDLELSARPYQTLRLSGAAVRSVCFHRRYPLFALGGDAGAVLCHGRVYSDLLQNPLLVPLKRLRAGGGPGGGAAVLQLVFHPTQPWLLAAHADHTLRLYA